MYKREPKVFTGLFMIFGTLAMIGWFATVGIDPVNEYFYKFAILMLLFAIASD